MYPNWKMPVANHEGTGTVAENHQQNRERRNPSSEARWFREDAFMGIGAGPRIGGITVIGPTLRPPVVLPESILACTPLRTDLALTLASFRLRLGTCEFLVRP